MNNTSPTHLTTVKTDLEKAREYKERLSAIFPGVCDIMTDAKREGILISWSIVPDAMGKFFVAQLTATKDLDR